MDIEKDLALAFSGEIGDYDEWADAVMRIKKAARLGAVVAARQEECERQPHLKCPYCHQPRYKLDKYTG